MDPRSKPRFRHHELSDRTNGRAQRMREGGAPAWLVRAEQEANLVGQTMRRVHGCGPQYYVVPLATWEEVLAESVEARERRRATSEPLTRMPTADAYQAALRGGGFTPDPGLWEGFEPG